jgi:hypothetical protein
LVREAAVKIDSKTYPVKDINELGFVVAHYQGDLVPRQRVYFDLLIQLGEREDAYAVDGLVVRTADRTLVCKFNDLRPDAKRALAQLVAIRVQRLATAE